MSDHESDLKARLQDGLNAGHREGSCGMDCGFDNEAAIDALDQAGFGRPLPDVNTLAQEIRRVDGDNALGAGALAEAILTFLRKQPPRSVDTEIPDDIVKLVTPFAAECNGTWEEHLDIVKAMGHCVMIDRLAQFGDLVQSSHADAWRYRLSRIYPWNYGSTFTPNDQGGEDLIQEPLVVPGRIVNVDDLSHGQPAIERRAGGWFVTGPNWSGPWADQESAELAKDGEYTLAHEANRAAIQNATALRKTKSL